MEIAQSKAAVGIVGAGRPEHFRIALDHRHRQGIEKVGDLLAAVVRDRGQVVEIDAADGCKVFRLVRILKTDRHALAVALEDLLHRDRPAEIVALQLGAAHLTQELGLLAGLDALADRLDAQGQRHFDELGHDDAVFRPLVKAVHEAHVQLDEVKMNILQNIQRGIAAAEVVHPDLEAQLLQALDLCFHKLEVLPDRAFGQLDGQLVAGDAGRVDAAADLIDDIAGLEVDAGDVQRLGHEIQALGLLFLQLQQNLVQHVEVQPVDQARVFQDRDKIARRDQASVRVDPAGKGLLVADPAAGSTDDRLEENLDPALFQGTVEVVYHIAVALDAGQHAVVKAAVVGHVGTAQHVAGIFGAVAGRAGIHQLQAVLIDAHTDGQGPAGVCAREILENRLQTRVHILTAGDGDEMILPHAAAVFLSEMAGDDVGRRAEQPVALFQAVLAVEVLHAVQIEEQQSRSGALLENAGSGAVGLLIKTAHARQACQLVGVDAPVQIADVLLQMVTHLAEGSGQDADLVLAVIIQLHIILAGSQPAGGSRQALQRRNDHAQRKHEHHRKYGDDRGSGNQNQLNQVGPGRGDLAHRRRHNQLHAAGERREGHLTLDAVIGVADFLSPAVFLPEDALLLPLAHDVGRAAHGKLRMVENRAGCVIEGIEARIVDFQRADLGHHGVKGNVHAQHAHQCPGLIDRRDVRNRHHLVKEMGRIRADPGGSAAFNGRIVPGGVFKILRVQPAGIQRRLLFKARPADHGIEEAVHGFAHLRREAEIVGHHPVGVVGNAAESGLHPGAVRSKIRVQFRRLFGRLAVRSGILPGHAALDQGDAVQRINRDIGCHLYRLFDAVKIVVQRLTLVLAQQGQLLGRVSVVFPSDGEKHHENDSRNADENRREGDGR